MQQESASNVTSLSSKSKKTPDLKQLAKMDPDVRGFLRAIQETGLRDKAVELLQRQIRAMKAN